MKIRYYKAETEVIGKPDQGKIHRAYYDLSEEHLANRFEDRGCLEECFIQVPRHMEALVGNFLVKFTLGEICRDIIVDEILGAIERDAIIDQAVIRD